MNPALRVKALPGRSTESGQNWGFFPCLPLFLLPFSPTGNIVNCFLPVTVYFGVFHMGSHSSPTLPASSRVCPGWVIDLQKMLSLRISLLIQTASEGSVFCSQPKSALIQHKYSKYILETSPLIVPSIWQSCTKAAPNFSCKTCY